MYINSNMTPREAFRFYGTLPNDLIEYLIEEQVANYAKDEASPHIQEAIAQYPDEDFIEAEGIFDELRAIAQRLRSENKSALLAVIEKLQQLELSIARQTEYGTRELYEALAITELQEI